MLLETLLLVIRTNFVPELPIEARLQRKARRRDLVQGSLLPQRQQGMGRREAPGPNSSDNTSEDSKKTR
jgi:hypothetical protein